MCINDSKYKEEICIFKEVYTVGDKKIASPRQI